MHISPILKINLMTHVNQVLTITLQLLKTVSMYNATAERN